MLCNNIPGVSELKSRREQLQKLKQDQDEYERRVSEVLNSNQAKDRQCILEVG